MQNPISTKIPELLTSGQDAAGGAAQFGPAIGLVHNTEANINADVLALTTGRDAYTGGLLTLKSRRQSVENLQQSAREFLTLARDVLKKDLGKKHSLAWVPTGFVKNLSIPMSAHGLQERLQTIQTFFTNNAALENAALSITAVRAGSLFNDLSAARVALNVQETTVGSLKVTRDNASDALQRRLRSLIGELGHLMGSLDERWLSFGLNKPGAAATPDVPENVTAVLLGNSAVVRWAGAPRADHYRVWKKVNGVDEGFVAVGSPADLELMVDGLPANSTIELAVSAVNSGGESQRSSVVTITTH